MLKLCGLILQLIRRSGKVNLTGGRSLAGLQAALQQLVSLLELP